MDCSVVIPVYFNEGSLGLTFDKVERQLRATPCVRSFEIIFVDDGSRDGSFAELQSIKQRSTVPVRLVKFPRNFGQVPAILAGYRQAAGRCVINISADLQDPPELISEMLQHHLEGGYEVVICSREDREESWYRKVTSQLFYAAMRRLSFPNMPEGGFDYVLLGSRAREFILSNEEANPFWQGQILWSGFEPKHIPYKRLKREHGRSRWTFSRKLKYLIDGVLGYSYFPLRAMSVMGIAVFLFGLIYATVITLQYFFGQVPFKGWAPIMILVLLLSGMQMLMLGILGEYLWRTLDQVRRRPLYLIETVIE